MVNVLLLGKRGLQHIVLLARGSRREILILPQGGVGWNVRHTHRRSIDIDQLHLEPAVHLQKGFLSRLGIELFLF